MPGHWSYSYSRWDGTQDFPDLDAEDILAEITDDLLYHGDIHAALRRLLRNGFRTGSGERILGLREILERARRRRAQLQAETDPDGTLAEAAAELEAVVGLERGAIDELDRAARTSGDERREQVTGDAMALRRMELDMLPPDVAGRMEALASYDFTSSEAQRRYEELRESLRRQVLDSYLDRLGDAVSRTTPAETARVRDALDALNRMIEQHGAGRPLDPSFEDFMARYGDLFPGNPADLDELLRQLAERMAAMSALLASMSPEQRAQLERLSSQLLADVDLHWQVSRLASNLQAALPGLDWDRRLRMSGSGGGSLAEALRAAGELGRLEDLERMLSRASDPGALADLDAMDVADLLGEDAARAVDALAALARRLSDAGLVELRGERLELTPRGLRHIGMHALDELFSHLAADRSGIHQLQRAGPGVERTGTVKDYRFGDPFNLNLAETLHRAVARGGRPPLRLVAGDFQMDETERVTRSATVVMVDLSLSMPMRDNFLAAKKVAMALYSLITSRFPQDYVGLVGFSEVAREIRPEELPEVSWDFVYGTNMAHGLALSRRLLERQYGTRQIVMITDGEPTAHLLKNGEVFFNYPPVPATVKATLAEVVRCTRAGVRINTFMLDASSHLRNFVEKMAELNRGRAFFTTPESLGEFVLVDFLEHKRASRMGGRAAGSA